MKNKKIILLCLFIITSLFLSFPFAHSKNDIGIESIPCEFCSGSVILVEEVSGQVVEFGDEYVGPFGEITCDYCKKKANV